MGFSIYGLLKPDKKFIDVFVAVIGHEQNMHVLKLLLSVIPFQLRVSGPGENKAIQDDAWIVQTFLYVLDPLVEKHLFAGGAFVQQAVRFDESEILLPTNEHPQDKVGMKITCLKEADALATAHVPKEEEFHSVLFQNRFVVVAPGLQVGDKLIFTFIKCHRKDGNFSTSTDMKQRLEQMFAEVSGKKISSFRKVVLFFG